MSDRTNNRKREQQSSIIRSLVVSLQALDENQLIEVASECDNTLIASLRRRHAANREPRAYNYCRVSTIKQDEDCKAQKAAAETYYNAILKPKGIGRDEHEPEAWAFLDTGISAKVPFLKRPGSFALHQRLRPGDHIVVSKFDRAFRSFRDLVRMSEIWGAGGVSIHVLNIGVDTSSIAGRMILRIMATFAEFERELIGERTKEALAFKEAVGGGSFGWKMQLTWIPERKAYCNIAIPAKVEREAMRLAYELHLAGMSDYDIAREFVKRRIPSKNKKVNWWNNSTINRIRKAWAAWLANNFVNEENPLGPQRWVGLPDIARSGRSAERVMKELKNSGHKPELIGKLQIPTLPSLALENKHAAHQGTIESRDFDEHF